MMRESSAVAETGWLRRLWRDLYWQREDRRIRKQYAGISQLVYFGGHGIGDELLLTAPLHELRRRGATGLGVMTSRPELFLYSPDVDFVRELNHRDTRFLQRNRIRAVHAQYIHEVRPPDIDVMPSRHIIAEMCRSTGLHGAVEIKPWIYLTPAERAKAAPLHRHIVLHSTGAGAALHYSNKEWGAANFVAVARVLSPRFKLIQIGLPGDPPLPVDVDLRGRTSLREMAAVLAGAAVFIGLEGFVAHLARAVDCAGVIVFGGRAHPEIFGYTANRNFYTAVPCAPCGRQNTCDFGRTCLAQITPEQVAAAAAEIAGRPARALTIDRAILP